MTLFFHTFQDKWVIVVLDPIEFPCMDKTQKHSLKYLLCSAKERKSYRFGTISGRVNDESLLRINISHY